ncbi:hypothetical protein PR202_gb13121 [Eleusine coracana subsp. coracana]|uniref:Uncharacterized protein n=1 Tax=Eleusine coracana subsp. coracana TaxID=191504 RepID=A0AAV5ES02_ELECO|nr:hypothetical protein PR202_gb13121 [Eleusine coracana subsp. coracana]
MVEPPGAGDIGGWNWELELIVLNSRCLGGMEFGIGNQTQFQPVLVLFSLPHPQFGAEHLRIGWNRSSPVALSLSRCPVAPTSASPPPFLHLAGALPPIAGTPTFLRLVGAPPFLPRRRPSLLPSPTLAPPSPSPMMAWSLVAATSSMAAVDSSLATTWRRGSGRGASLPNSGFELPQLQHLLPHLPCCPESSLCLPVY